MPLRASWLKIYLIFSYWSLRSEYFICVTNKFVLIFLVGIKGQFVFLARFLFKSARYSTCNSVYTTHPFPLFIINPFFINQSKLLATDLVYLIFKFFWKVFICQNFLDEQSSTLNPVFTPINLSSSYPSKLSTEDFQH